MAGTVTRNIGTGWTGERLLDWTGAGSNIRIYGENAHHDVTWLASSTGTVSQALRYDPWGTPTGRRPDRLHPVPVPGLLVRRHDRPVVGRHPLVCTAAWVASSARTRSWAMPSIHRAGSSMPMGRASRSARWDPDGRFWYRVKATDSIIRLAGKYLGDTANWGMIANANHGRNRFDGTYRVKAGVCAWIPLEWHTVKGHANVGCPAAPRPKSAVLADAALELVPNLRGALQYIPVPGGWFNLKQSFLYHWTERITHRKADISYADVDGTLDGLVNPIARDIVSLPGSVVRPSGLTDIKYVYNNPSWPATIDKNASAFTFGYYIFLAKGVGVPPPVDLVPMSMSTFSNSRVKGGG